MQLPGKIILGVALVVAVGSAVWAYFAIRGKMDRHEIWKTLLGPSVSAAMAALVALAVNYRPEPAPAAEPVAVVDTASAEVATSPFLPEPEARRPTWGGLCAPPSGGATQQDEQTDRVVRNLRIELDSALEPTARNHLRTKLAELLRRGDGLDDARLQVAATLRDDPPAHGRIFIASATLDVGLHRESGEVMRSVHGGTGRGASAEVARRNALSCAALDATDAVKRAARSTS